MQDWAQRLTSLDKNSHAKLLEISLQETCLPGWETLWMDSKTAFLIGSETKRQRTPVETSQRSWEPETGTETTFRAEGWWRFWTLGQDCWSSDISEYDIPGTDSRTTFSVPEKWWTSQLNSDRIKGGAAAWPTRVEHSKIRQQLGACDQWTKQTLYLLRGTGNGSGQNKQQIAPGLRRNILTLLKTASWSRKLKGPKNCNILL